MEADITLACHNIATWYVFISYYTIILFFLLTSKPGYFSASWGIAASGGAKNATKALKWMKHFVVVTHHFALV